MSVPLVQVSEEDSPEYDVYADCQKYKETSTYFKGVARLLLAYLSYEDACLTHLIRTVVVYIVGALQVVTGVLDSLAYGLNLVHTLIHQNSCVD